MTRSFRFYAEATANRVVTRPGLTPGSIAVSNGMSHASMDTRLGCGRLECVKRTLTRRASRQDILASGLSCPLGQEP
jgi:hypothetical protein